MTGLAAALAWPHDLPVEAQVCLELAQRVRMFARRRMPDAEAVEDFVQETLLVVLEGIKAGRVDPGPDLGAYALATCRGRIADAQRTHARRSQLLAQLPAEAVREPGEPIPAEALSRCIQRLEARAKRIVMETFVLGAGGKALAEKLGMTEANVRVVRCRAIALLRMCLDGGAR